MEEDKGYLKYADADAPKGRMALMDYSRHDSLEQQLNSHEYNLWVSQVDRMNMPWTSLGIFAEEKHYLELVIDVRMKKIRRDHCGEHK